MFEITPFYGTGTSILCRQIFFWSCLQKVVHIREGRTHIGCTHYSRTHEGRTHEGRTHEGRPHKGRTQEGRAHQVRTSFEEN